MIIGLLISLILISNVFAVNLDVNRDERVKSREKGLKINMPSALKIDSPTDISFTITNITDKAIVFNNENNFIEMDLDYGRYSEVIWSTYNLGDGFALKPGEKITIYQTLNPSLYGYELGKAKLVLEHVNLETGYWQTGKLGKTSINVRVDNYFVDKNKNGTDDEVEKYLERVLEVYGSELTKEETGKIKKILGKCPGCKIERGV